MTTFSPLRAEEVVDRLATALAVGAADRRETHGSWVLLTPSRAYKVKKPVTMAFLDYGTARAPARDVPRGGRRQPAGRARRLPRRAGDRARGDGVELAPEDAPDAIEYAVEMRRFDEAATLAAALATGRRRRSSSRTSGAASPPSTGRARRS